MLFVWVKRQRILRVIFYLILNVYAYTFTSLYVSNSYAIFVIVDTLVQWCLNNTRILQSSVCTDVTLEQQRQLYTYDMYMYIVTYFT